MEKGADRMKGPLAGRILRGAVWTAIEAWAQQVVLLVIFIAMARLVGPESLGLALLAQMVPVLVQTALVKGYSDALVQRRDLEPLHSDSVFWLLLASGAASAGLVSLLAEHLAGLFSRPALASPIRWSSLLIVLTCLGAVPAALLRRDLAFRELAIRTLVGTVSGGIVGCTMAFAGYGMWSLIAMQLVRQAGETTYLLMTSDWQPRLRFSLLRCRELIGFAGPVTTLSAWNYVNDELPKFIIGIYLGATQVGLYGLARRPLEFLSSSLLGPLSSVTMPAIARMQDDPRRVRVYYGNSIRVSALVGFPAFAGLAAIAPEFVPLVLGERWNDCIPAIQVIMLVGLLRTVDGIAAGLALAHGHSSLFLYFTFAYTGIAAVLLLLAAPYGLEATMAAIVAANALLLPPFLYLVGKRTGIDLFEPLRTFPRIAAATSVMLLAIAGWRHVFPAHLHQLAFVVSAVGIGVVTYGIAALALLRRELNDARELLTRAMALRT